MGVCVGCCRRRCAPLLLADGCVQYFSLPFDLFSLWSPRRDVPPRRGRSPAVGLADCCGHPARHGSIVMPAPYGAPDCCAQAVMQSGPCGGSAERLPLCASTRPSPTWPPRSAHRRARCSRRRRRQQWPLPRLRLRQRVAGHPRRTTPSPHTRSSSSPPLPPRGRSPRRPPPAAATAAAAPLPLPLPMSLTTRRPRQPSRQAPSRRWSCRACRCRLRGGG